MVEGDPIFHGVEMYGGGSVSDWAVKHIPQGVGVGSALAANSHSHKPMNHLSQTGPCCREGPAVDRW